MPHLYALFLLITSFSITACAPFSPSDRRAAVCNELNSKMIFSGSSAVDRVTDLQQAEAPLIQSQYDKKCTK